MRTLDAKSAQTEHTRHNYQVTISLDVILISLELLSFASVSVHFGVLVIMVTKMIQDVLSFFLLLLIVIVAFSLSFLGLSSEELSSTLS